MVLTALKAPMLPLPLAGKPMLGVLLVHWYTIVPPVVGELKSTAAVDAPLQTIWLATVFTVALGFTVMVKVRGVPTQVTPALV